MEKPAFSRGHRRNMPLMIPERGHANGDQAVAVLEIETS